MAQTAKQAKPRKKRPLFLSRLARLIFLSNLTGLIILILGATAMNRFEDGLIEAKVNNLTTQAELMGQIMAESATGFGVSAELDVEGAKAILRQVELPDGWRVRLHDRSASLIADSEAMTDDISVSVLEPLDTAPPEPPTRWEMLMTRASATYTGIMHNLPWRAAERERLRRNLRADILAALEGETRAGAAYESDDSLMVSISIPLRRVQNVLAVLTLESDDIDDIVAQEREALLPIIGIACLAALLSSIGLTWAIARPVRRLARAAEAVAKSSDKRDIIPDLSRRRDDIGDLSVRMREMSRGLYDRIDDVANFAADVAHEIKNPLTSLRSATDTLNVARTDEQRGKLIDIIQQDVGRINRLITDISAASRIDAELARERVATVDVVKMLGHMVDIYDSTTEPSAPRVRVMTERVEGEVFIRAFETPFAQVLRNLIDNAMTFTNSEDGEVHLGVDVATVANRRRVFIAVDDDGPGIPDDAIEDVFSRFYTDRTAQSPIADLDSFGSHSGLGLTICRQIVTAHKGTIHAENRRDADGKIEGARFVIELPRATQGGAPSRKTRQTRTAAKPAAP